MTSSEDNVVNKLNSLVQSVAKIPSQPTSVLTISTSFNHSLIPSQNVVNVVNPDRTTSTKKDWKKENKKKVNELERKRKERLASHISKLKSLVPSNGVLLVTKESVVERACDYIHELHRKLDTMVQKGASESEELSTLREKVKMYEKERKEYQDLLISHGIHPILTGTKKVKVAISKPTILKSSPPANSTSGNTVEQQSPAVTSQCTKHPVIHTSEPLLQNNAPCMSGSGTSIVSTNIMTSQRQSGSTMKTSCRLIWSQSWSDEEKRSSHLPSIPTESVEEMRKIKSPHQHAGEPVVADMAQSALLKPVQSISASISNSSKNFRPDLSTPEPPSGLQTWLRSNENRNVIKPTSGSVCDKGTFQPMVKLKKSAENAENSVKVSNSFNIASLMKSQPTNQSKSPPSVPILTTIHATQTSDTTKDFTQSFETDFFECLQNIPGLNVPDTPNKQIADTTSTHLKPQPKTPRDRKLCSSLSLELNDIFRIDQSAVVTEVGKLDCPNDIESASLTNLLMSPQEVPTRQPKQVEIVSSQRLPHPIWQPAITSHKTTRLNHKTPQYTTNNESWNHQNRDQHNVSRIISAKSYTRTNTGLKRKHEHSSLQMQPACIGLNHPTHPHKRLQPQPNPTVDNRPLFGHFGNPVTASTTRYNPDYQALGDIYTSPSVQEYYHQASTGYRFTYNHSIPDYPAHPMYLPHLSNTNINYNNNNNNEVKHSRASQHHIRQILG
uniref:BHLH domain-containing protein n=1 Tax=Ciona savignyi TaxID=51511 RepID=H2YF56_CIOSA